MLFLTGGLVLGETMALWMTVEQECFGLAALLLVFSCAFWHDDWFVRGRGKEKGGMPALFAVLAVWTGLAVGAGRMEYEEWNVRREWQVIERIADTDVWVVGQVAELQEVEFGVRLLLQDCEMRGIEDGQRGRELWKVRGSQKSGEPWDAGTSQSAEASWDVGEPQSVSEIRNLYVYIDFEASYELELGRKVVVKGKCEIPEGQRNPGGFDYRSYCLSKGVCGIFHAKEVLTGTGAWKLREGIRQMGLCLERKLEQLAEGDDLGILKAVLLGKKTEMNEQVYDLYRKNGISHILAISGLHVSVIGMGIWKGLRKLGLGYGEAGLLAFGLLSGYGAMTGFGPSVVRAVFMMGISFLASVCGRTYDLPSAMCIPALGLLLWRPYLLTQASFQLSFLAVGAMFLPGNALAEHWKLQGIKQNIWISLSLQMVTLPVVLAHSYEIPVFGVLLNLIVVPLMAYVLVSGLLGVAVGFISAELGVLCLGGAHWILTLYRSLCHGIQNIPGATMILGRPDPWELVLYYSTLGFGIRFARKARRGWPVWWLVAILVLFPQTESGLSVTFLDVGQGDGIYLEADGKTMLVDCGSSQEKDLGTDVLIPFFKSQGISRLDTIVVTHGDQDHVSGIEELLVKEDSGIDVERLILPCTGSTDPMCLRLEKLALDRGMAVFYCGAGDSLDGLLVEKVELECMNPAWGQGTEKIAGKGAGVGNLGAGKEMEETTGETDRNDNSLVLQLTYGDFSMLLAGDIGAEVEKELMERELLAPVTVLKAAHHGSAGSSSREFLEIVQPAYVIFSYGEGNSYGHPAPKVIDNCKEIGAKIYETAEAGAIRLWTDGSRLRMEGWLDRHGGI